MEEDKANSSLEYQEVTPDWVHRDIITTINGIEFRKFSGRTYWVITAHLTEEAAWKVAEAFRILNEDLKATRFPWTVYKAHTERTTDGNI